MFCPNCGKVNSAQQKFCRSCGLSLEKVAQSVGEQLRERELSKDLLDRQRKVERLLSILLGSMLAIFAGAVLWALIFRIMIAKGEVLGGLIFLVLFLAAVIALLLVVYRESLLEKLAKRQLVEASSPLTENTAELLPESHLEPVPSVTEGTTKRLFAEKKNGIRSS